MKICPNCGSEEINWITPIDNTLWVCETCDYIGPVIEGNEILISELLKDCIEQVKEENNLKENENNLIKKSVMISQDHLKKIDQIQETGFSSKMRFILDSYFSQIEQVTYEEKVINRIDSNIGEIYNKLKEEILSWNYKIEFKARKSYFTFSYYSEFLKISLDTDKIYLTLSFSANEPFDDYKDITKEILDDENDEIIRLTFSLNKHEDIDYALFLIKQSYENNKKSNIGSLITKILPQSKYF